MRLFLILLFQCVLISNVIAQKTMWDGDNNKSRYIGPKRNIISADGESILVAGHYTINYERIWIGDEKIRFSTRAGIGKWYIWEDMYGTSYIDNFYKCSFNLFWMRRYIHSHKMEYGFEIGMGFSIRMADVEHSDQPYIYYSVREPAFWPILTLGIRTSYEHIQMRGYASSFGVGMTIGFSF